MGTTKEFSRNRVESIEEKKLVESPSDYPSRPISVDSSAWKRMDSRSGGKVENGHFLLLEEIRSTFRCRSSSRDISCRCIRFERDTCSEDSPFAYRIIAPPQKDRFFFARKRVNPFCGLFARVPLLSFPFFRVSYRVFAQPRF